MNWNSKLRLAAPPSRLLLVAAIWLAILLPPGGDNAQGAELTLTLGKKPVYIEPAGELPPGEPPAEAITKSAFGVNHFVIYNKEGFTYKLRHQIKHLKYVDIGFQRWNLANVPKWGAIQKDKTAGYGFRKHDRRLSRLTGKAGVDLLVTIGFYAPWDQDECHPVREGPMYPCNVDLYLNYLQTTVERYDGDDDYGCTLPQPDCYRPLDNKYPTWDVASRPRVKYWQLGNELDKTKNWADTPQNYAALLTQSYNAIKQVCSDCQVLMGGEAGGSLGQRIYDMSPFYQEVIASLDGQYFDIIDNHLYKKKGDYNVYRDRQNQYIACLNAKGFTNVEFWLTEMGTYAGTPRRRLPYQTEEDQATELAKRYVYLFASGVKKVCWTGIMEHGWYHGNVCDYHNFTGLIHNPVSPEDCSNKDNPKNFGLRNKKLSYYTYKLLIEKLTGGDWNDIQIIQEADNVYVYRFKVNGKPVYVAWWDWFNDVGEGRTINLDVSDITTGSVTITEAVPDAPTGADLTDDDYPLFFNSVTVPLP